ENLVKGFRKFLVLFIAAIFIIAATPSLARAADYYLATTGSDSNPGTLAAPFQTLERGVRDLKPGDTLHIRGGTYKRTTHFWDPPSGTSWDNAVTITNYNNEQVIIRPFWTENCCDAAGHTVFSMQDGKEYK